MGLFSSKIYSELPFYQENGIKILTIGDLSPLPEDAKKAINDTIEATKNNDTIKPYINNVREGYKKGKKLEKEYMKKQKEDSDSE